MRALKRRKHCRPTRAPAPSPRLYCPPFSLICRQKCEIAYLEKYSLETKPRFEAVRQARAAGHSQEQSINLCQIPRNTWVRRLRDPVWRALNTPEGEQIVRQWNTPGPDGQIPVVCSP